MKRLLPVLFVVALLLSIVEARAENDYGAKELLGEYSGDALFGNDGKSAIACAYKRLKNAANDVPVSKENSASQIGKRRGD